MLASPVSLALTALLAPGAVALLLAVATPLRNRKSAIVLSVLAALSSLVRRFCWSKGSLPRRLRSC